MVPRKGKQDEVLGEASSDNFQRHSFEQDGKKESMNMGQETTAGVKSCCETDNGLG